MKRETTSPSQYSQVRAEMNRAQQEIKRVRVLGEKIETEYSQKSDANEKLEQVAREKYQRELKKLTKGDYNPILCFHDEEKIFTFAEKHHIDPIWFYQQLSQATSFANQNFFRLDVCEKPENAYDYWYDAIFALKGATLFHNRPCDCPSEIARATKLFATAQELARAKEEADSDQKFSVVHQFLKENTENLANFYYLEQNPSFSANDI